jgi:hypothetical protein
MDAVNKKRGSRAGVTLLATGLASFVVAGVVAAGPAAANNGGSSGAPPGNNATIKINNVPVDGVDNQPHITCPFRLSLYNFDSGSTVSNSATVTFVAQPPSGKNIVLPPSVGMSTFTFPGPDYFQDYSFDAATLDQLTLHPQQGYHVKVTVKVTSTGVTHGKADAKSNSGSNGNGKANGKGNGKGNATGNGKSGTKETTKHKVFWLTCVAPTVTPTPTPTVTPTPTPTTAVLGEKHTRKPPTTHVKAVHVTRLPFTGISSRVLAISALSTAGFVFMGTGLVLLGRRPKTQFVQ